MSAESECIYSKPCRGFEEQKARLAEAEALIREVVLKAHSPDPDFARWTARAEAFLRGKA